MAKCKQCCREFEAKRSTAQYCSPGCRVKANRLSVTVSVTKSVTVSDSVTPEVMPRQDPTATAEPAVKVQHYNPMMIGYEPSR